MACMLNYNIITINVNNKKCLYPFFLQNFHIIGVLA